MGKNDYNLDLSSFDLGYKELYNYILKEFRKINRGGYIDSIIPNQILTIIKYKYLDLVDKF